MEISVESLRRRYAECSDDELLSLNRDELYDEELASRQIAAELAGGRSSVPAEDLGRPFHERWPVAACASETNPDSHPPPTAPDHSSSGSSVGSPNRKNSKSSPLRAFENIGLTIKALVAVALLVLAVVTLEDLGSSPDMASTVAAATCLITFALLSLRFVRTRGATMTYNSITILFLAYVLVMLLSAFSRVKSTEALDFQPFFDNFYGGLLLFLLGVVIYERISKTTLLRPEDLSRLRLEFLVLRSFMFDLPRPDDELRPFTHFLFRLVRLIRWLPLMESLEILSDLRYACTYESILRSCLDQGAISATVHNPQWKGIPPATGRLVEVPRGQDWRIVVRGALGVTSWVVGIPGVSLGLREELSIIRQDDAFLARFLLLVPSELEADLGRRYCAVLQEVGFGRPPEGLRAGSLYRFTQDGIPQEIATAIETATDAGREIRAWAIFQSSPDTAWCPVDDCNVQPSPLGRCPVCGLFIDVDRASAIVGADENSDFVCDSTGEIIGHRLAEGFTVCGLSDCPAPCPQTWPRWFGPRVR